MGRRCHSWRREKRWNGEKRKKRRKMVETGFGLQQPEAAEARMALAADDEVIVDCDAERLGGGANLLGHLDVVARRLGIARWVIVHEDEGARLVVQGALHHLARIDRRVVDRAALL